MYVCVYIYIYTRNILWVQSSPHQTERVRGQTIQSLWMITCPPPEQTPGNRVRKLKVQTHWVTANPPKKKKRIYIYIYIYTHTRNILWRVLSQSRIGARPYVVCGMWYALYVYVYYVYIYIHIYIYIVRERDRERERLYMCICVYMCMYIYVYVYMYICGMLYNACDV